MTSALTDKCQGKWPSILMSLGLPDAKALAGADTACPRCGGTDRFRFSDKGFGRWFCRGCGYGGDGVRLVQMVKGVDFLAARDLIEGVVGKCPAPDKTNGNGAGATLDPLKSWRWASSILGSVGDVYLQHRAIKLNVIEARALGFHTRLWHWPSQTKWPCMVALVRLHDGTELTTHQTFLEEDGSAKARILGDKVRLFPKGGRTDGGGIWFGVVDPKREFIVAEGVESALSAMRIYGAPAGCAALSAGGIARLILPPGARRVRIFADHDPLNQGLAAAVLARARWRVEGREVAITRARQVGWDANDVWMKRAGL
jgi:putative DNA primase/helicase